jgi:hypothetical protein
MRDGATLRKGAIYVRGEGVTEEATHDQLQEMINGRLATGHSTQSEMDLNAHLNQLKALYVHIQPSHVSGSLLGAGIVELVRSSMEQSSIESSPNQKYPKEDFESFIVRMIEAKKRRIERELDCP